MASPGGKWSGVPTGFRIRIPLAGMPSMHGIRNSGQQPLPAWADPTAPPSTWKPPSPHFEDQQRQIELTRLVATLKPLQEPDAVTHLLQRAARGASERGGESVVQGWAVEELDALAAELSVIESQATHRAERLQKMRANLHTIAHGELGIRTRRREDSIVGGVAAVLGAAAVGGPPTSEAVPAQPWIKVGLNLKGAAPLSLTGVPGSFPSEEGGDLRRSEGMGLEGSIAAAPDSCAESAGGSLTSAGVDGGGGPGGGAGGGAPARRSSQSAQTKAQAEAKARSELGEAAGYVKERHKAAQTMTARWERPATTQFAHPYSTWSGLGTHLAATLTTV